MHLEDPIPRAATLTCPKYARAAAAAAIPLNAKKTI